MEEKKVYRSLVQIGVSQVDLPRQKLKTFAHFKLNSRSLVFTFVNINCKKEGLRKKEKKGGQAFFNLLLPYRAKPALS